MSLASKRRAVVQEQFVWILHGINFIDSARANADCFIIAVSSDESTIYRKACSIILKELVDKFGKPKKYEKDDDLADDKIFNNQQVVLAYEFYDNDEKIESGTNKGSPKFSWYDKFRRIENIYEKMRSSPLFNDMCGNYYYVDKQKVIAKR